MHDENFDDLNFDLTMEDEIGDGDFDIEVFEEVFIDDTPVGKGIFALRDYPPFVVVGEILGEVIHDENYRSDYCFDLENGSQLEPNEPFRYVNHSCDPNCEFEWFDEEDQSNMVHRRAYLISIRDIDAGEEFTIDYSWPAEGAIPCKCGSENCRGWVVAEDEVEWVNPFNNSETDGSNA